MAKSIVLAGYRRHRVVACLMVGALTACAGASKPSTEPSTVVAAAPSATETSIATAEANKEGRAPVIVEGSGKLIGTPGQASSEPRTAQGDGYQLNFIDVEIGSVVASVLGDGLGLPYFVDPEVKGTMTLDASRPLARDEILPALEAALEVHNVALVNVGGTYHAVPTKDALRRSGSIRTEALRQQPGFAVQIVPVKYVSVTEIEKILRPFARDNGVVRVDEGRNLLVLAGTSREIGVMMDVIQTFDANWLEGMSFGLFPVEYVDANTIADELGAIFQGKSSPISGVVRLVPLSRLNSLMVITHEPSYLKQIEAWIKRLDVGLASPGRRIYVYDVQNGKADDLAKSLKNILSIAGGEPLEDESAVSRIEPFDSFGTGEVGTVRDGSASGMRSRLSPSTRSNTTTSTPQSAVDNTTPGALKIVPNVETNTLLIYATPNEFTLIETAVKRLDVLPIQVLIEASLAEVTLTDDLKYGLQWSYQSGDGPIILSEASRGTISQKFPGFSYLYTGRQDIRAVLNAIESLTDVKVISSPKLLVLNNREAQLQIGDQVPITVQSSVSTIGETSPIVNSVQMRDTGVILQITPRANKSGLVLLDILQEVSNVVPTTTSSIDSPTIQQRRIASSIAVRDGETIALGGLIREGKSRSRGGIPYLRRIPLLGDLFGSTDKSSQRTELIVLITPRLVRSAAEADAMMQELKEQFRGLRKTLPTVLRSTSPRASPPHTGTGDPIPPQPVEKRIEESPAHSSDPAAPQR